MLTVVALLLFPAILAMSMYRLYQFPRDMFAGRKWLNPKRRLVSAAACAVTYGALAAYTAHLLYVLARVFAFPPRAIDELFDAAFTLAGYPFVYLAYEWFNFYAAHPRPRRG